VGADIRVGRIDLGSSDSARYDAASPGKLVPAKLDLGTQASCSVVNGHQFDSTFRSSLCVFHSVGPFLPRV
jgi:hypothetical protein